MKLHTLLSPILGVALASTAFAGSTAEPKAPAMVAAEESALLGFTLTAGYDSHYIYRGVDFAENLVSVGIDGNIPFNEMISLNVGAWFGTSADDSATLGGSYNELDLYAAVLVDLGPATVGLKYQHYKYLGNAGDLFEDINEVGALVSTTLGPVDFSGGAYYDETADGFYFEAGISKAIEITDRISLVPAALVSYAIDYYGVDGFNHVKAGVSLPIKLTDTATLTPYVAYNLPIDALDDLGEDEQLYGGISLSVSF
ncbi:hypothetical protein FEM03_06845 [Phragmitibacter flavus]|uniref:Uncharacterized protein n=1 Tax=Phragmitibacter flavus TaxID=2576071 RepID=A0A5R8KG30_9BACT|nr:TorF family putative porin [Phragmitibacter flavus]TLD71246.1 hypothetical protein FEM03_06845 [Phragmitibacter flavus]